MEKVFGAIVVVFVFTLIWGAFFLLTWAAFDLVILDMIGSEFDFKWWHAAIISTFINVILTKFKFKAK